MRKKLWGVTMSTLCAVVSAATVFSSTVSYASDNSSEITTEDEIEAESDEANEGAIESSEDDAASLNVTLSEDTLDEADTEAEEATDFISESKILSEKESSVSVNDLSEEEDNISWSYDTKTNTLTISGSGAIGDFDSNKEQPWYSYRTKAKYVVIEEGITRIGKRSFADFNNYSSTIGGRVEFRFPSTLNSIGAYAFDYASTFGDLVIADNVTDIESYAFANARINGRLYIKAPVKKLEANSFYGIKVNKVFLPDTLEEIGEKAFCNALSIRDVTFPASIKKIESKAFSIKALKTVKFDGEAPEIAEDAFKGAVKNLAVTYDGSKRSFRDVTADKLGMAELDPVLTPEYPDKECTVSFAFESAKYKDVVVPEQVVKCGQYAAAPDLSDVSFAEGVNLVFGLYYTSDGEAVYSETLSSVENILITEDTTVKIIVEGEPSEPDEPEIPTPENPETPDTNNKLVEKWESTYYVSEDGTKLTGFQTIDGQDYYFNARGVMQKQTWITVDGVTYYASAEGALLKNCMFTKWGQTYVLDENGAMKTGFISFDGKDYYANEKGHLAKQTFFYVDGSKYYAKGDFTLAKNETITKWGKKYTFDENGRIVE